MDEKKDSNQLAELMEKEQKLTSQYFQLLGQATHTNNQLAKVQAAIEALTTESKSDDGTP